MPSLGACGNGSRHNNGKCERASTRRGAPCTHPMPFPRPAADRSTPTLRTWPHRCASSTWQYLCAICSPTQAPRLPSRRVVLIGVEQDGITGWGEAAPFPGITTEDVGNVWDALHQQADLVARRSLGLLPATAEAAADQAHEDLTARQIGTQLWARLGGSDQPIPVTVAIGIQPSPALAIESIAKAVEAGFHSVKLKIGPGRDIAYLAAARDAFGELSIAADANGELRARRPLSRRGRLVWFGIPRTTTWGSSPCRAWSSARAIRDAHLSRRVHAHP